MSDHLSYYASTIPGPVAKWGQGLIKTEDRLISYDGQKFPRFLLDHGGDPKQYRQFLWDNHIGDPFTLERGHIVTVSQSQTSKTFPKHPEA